MHDTEWRRRSPYETPDIGELVYVEVLEAVGEVVGDADVVCIEEEILEGDMDGEEGGGEEETEKEGMGGHQFQRRRATSKILKTTSPSDHAPSYFEHATRHVARFSLLSSPMKALFASLFLCLGLVSAQQDSLKKLTELAAAGNGVIHLDGPTFDILTSPKRTWSASIQFTALSKNRMCNPCK